MAPSLKSFYRGNSAAQQGQQQQSKISVAGAVHRSQGHNETYSCPYESEDWSSPRAPAPVKTSIDLFDEESPPSSPKERTSITITIPLPWPRKFSRRSSSVPANTRYRRRADPAISPDAHITSPIPGTVYSPEVQHITSPVQAPVHSPEVHQVISTVSPPIGNPKQIPVPSTKAPALSPVNEGFASPDSAETTNDPSPITPIDQDAQEDFDTTTLATATSNCTIADPSQAQAKEILRQETARQIEFGVPLASNPVFPARDDRPFSRASPFDPSAQHRNEPAPGLAATAFMRSPPMAAPYGYQWELRARSPSVPATRNTSIPSSADHRRVPSDGSIHRRHSASTSRQSQATDNESTTSSENRNSRSSRGSWQQLQRAQQQAEAGAGVSVPGSADSYAIGPAFYRSVTDEYKKILRNSGNYNTSSTSAADTTSIIVRHGSTPETVAPAKTPVGLNLTRLYHCQQQQPQPQHQQKTIEIDTMGEPGPEVHIVDDTHDHMAPLHTLVPSGQELWG